MSNERALRNEDMDRIYKKYVKPLERDHTGEYALVTPDGRTVLAATLLEIVEQGQRAPSKDNCIFKIGEKVIGRL